MAFGEIDPTRMSVLAAAGPYPLEAFGFVHAGLGYTVRRVHGEGTPSGSGDSSTPSGGPGAGQPPGHVPGPKPGQSPSQSSNQAPTWGGGFRPSIHVDEGSPVRRHVNGQQLCMGLRDYAVDRFGLFAPAVFGQWHIHRTDDFGRMVFAMIKAEIMSRTSEDSIDDFRGVYDFDEAFSRDALLGGIGVRPDEPRGVSQGAQDPGVGHDR